jgi:hypothetical protein
MATSIYLGNPPENIKKWILEHVQTGPTESPLTKIWFADEPDKCYEYNWQGVFDTCAGKEKLKGDVYSGDDTPFWRKSPIKIIIGTQIQSTGDYAFYGCSELKSVTIPKTLSIIRPDCFQGGTLNSLNEIIFLDRTIEEVQTMECYPWSIDDTSVIKVA